MSSKDNKLSNNTQIHDRISKTAQNQISKTQKNGLPYTYRQSGHLGDQMLKHSPLQGKDLSTRLINESLNQKMQKQDIRIEGINLSRTQERMVHAINKLLHLKSLKSSNSNFYSGNIPSTEFIAYGGLRKPRVFLSFTWGELCQIYLDKTEYSGSEMSFVKDTLHNLAKQDFLIIYDRRRLNEYGEEVTDRIESVDPLIRIMSCTEGLTKKEVNLLDSSDLDSIKKIKSKKTTLVVSIHPIFNDQIETKYIKYSSDIFHQLMIAAGGHRHVTESMTKLMGELLRASSSKKNKIEFNHETLPKTLSLENYTRQGRRKALWKRIHQDCEALIKLGLLSRYEDKPNSKGSLKRVFFINRDFQK